MSVDSTAEPVPDPPPAQRDLPRLRIHHFLAWTAVMAAMLVVLDWTKIFDSSQTLWAVTIVIVGHVLCSAALTCALFGVGWWRRGLRFPSEPGHALVILTGIATMLNELLIVLFSAFMLGEDVAAYNETGVGVSQWVMWLMRWSGMPLAVLSILFAIWLVRGWRWRSVFALLAAMFAANVAVQAFYSLLFQAMSSGNVYEKALWINLSTDAIPTAILLLCIVLAVMEDRRLAISRHWSHWVGVGVYTLDSAFKLIRYAVWYLLLGGT